MKWRRIARASGYSSLGFSAMSRDKLVRMAWGTYHTDQTAARPSWRSWDTGKPSALSMASASASGWAEMNSASTCSEAL